MASFLARTLVPLAIPDVFSYEACELLYEFPSILCTSSWERFLDNLNGVDCQGEVGGDGEHPFVDRRGVGVWRGNVWRALLRSHALIF